jgi:hypothetical protein
MKQKKMNLWDDERTRLLKLSWEAEDRFRNFAIQSPLGYESVTIKSGVMTTVKAPCCGNTAWLCQELLHKCQFCREYYYVLGEEDDDKD